MSNQKNPILSQTELDDTLSYPHPQPETPPPPPVKVQVEFGARTHAGKIREHNEDHYAIVKFARTITPLYTNLKETDILGGAEECTYGLVVADGMGGQVGGEVASGTAIQTLMGLVAKAPKWVIKVNEQEANELMERAARYFKKVDSALTEKAKNEPRLAGMGTTLTAAYNTGRDAFVVHVGDSRAYVYRNQQLYQLTRDHTVAQALADAGTIQPEEVPSHPLRHMLTNAIGYRAGQVDAEIQHIPLYDSDRLLLCTDGLTEMVDDQTISNVLAQNDSSMEASRILVDLALENGGKDNVTVLVAKYKFQ